MFRMLLKEMTAFLRFIKSRMNLVISVLAILSGTTASRRVMWYPAPEKESTNVPGSSSMPWIVVHDGNRNPYPVFIKKIDNPMNSNDPIDPSSVKFYIYTSPHNSTRHQLYFGNTTSLLTSSFNFNYPTKVVIHGYLNDADSPSIQYIKNAFMVSGNYNVIGVDWSAHSNTALYNLAADKTKPVGEHVSLFLDHFVQSGHLQLKDLHIIGYSLGAHIAGFISKNLKAGKPPRITGLDPARPFFEDAGIEGRLDASDADFVDCIHTCGGYLGIKEPICHADFYPNGGHERQPGCSWIWFGTCSHARSYEFFAESILKGHRFYCAKCKSLPDKTPVTCKKSRALMGYPASPKNPGIFYTTTNSEFPYALFVTA